MMTGDTAISDNGSNLNLIDIKNTINTSSKPDPVIPLQFPPRADYFTGRTEQLTKLINDLQPRKVVTLCGAGGMGKTALAAEAVYSLVGEKNKPPERFPDGVVFHSFYDHSTAESALRTIVRAFDIKSEGAGETTEELAKKALNAKTVLIVLDGAEDADDLKLVLRVLDTVGGCGVLITTRDKRQGGENTQKMQPLLIEDAVTLLEKWAADYIDNQAVATEICERVGGLPLAVRLVGRYLKEAEEFASSYLEWLEENMLEALDPDDSERRHESVKVLLARSVAQLNDAGRQMLLIFGCLLMKPVPFPALAAAVGFSQGKSKKVIKSLINFGLIQANKAQKEQYEVTHALIHTYTCEQAVLSDQVLGRLADWYFNFARKETKKGLQGYYILDTQQAHILYLIEQAHQRQQWKAVINLVWAVDQYLDIRGYWQERKQVLSLGLTAAQAIGQRQNEGVFLGSLGSAYFQLGELDKAIKYYQQALVISREIGDRRSKGVLLGNLGIAYSDLGELDKAIDYYQQALIIIRKIGDQKSEGNALGNLGNAYNQLGKLEKAIDYYQQTLVISRKVDDRKSEGSILGNLGSAYKGLGKLEKAIDYYQQALVISREIGDRKGEGADLGNLGNAYKDLGEVEKAIDYHQQALVISRKIGDRKAEGQDLNNLGLAYEKLNQPDIARDYFQQALVIFEAIRSPNAEETRENLKRLDQVTADFGEQGSLF